MLSFAIIPAAGRSERMGQPKLLLPWGDTTIIEHVIGIWRSSQVAHVIVVVHPQDQRVAQLSRACGALVVQPDVAPSEMKVSVQLGLDFIAREFQPQPADAWLLAPADMPGIAATTIDQLLSVYQIPDRSAGGSARIWAPRCGGRRGHPVLFAWSLAADVQHLGPDEGIKALLARNAVEYIDTAQSAILEDVDTPDDYARLRNRHDD